MYTHIMLIWILIDVQYLQNFAFNDQNHSPSDTHHPIKKIASKLLFLIPYLSRFPLILNTI